MNQETVNTLFYFLPELTLAAAVIVLNLVNSGEKVYRNSYYIYLFSAVLSLLFSVSQAYFFPQHLFAGAFSADHYAYGAKVILSAAILFSAAALNSRNTSPVNLVLQLVSFIGALMLSGISNIFMLFFTLQLILIPFYLMLHKSSKPAKKVFITGSIFSAILLYGLTLFYGLTGKTDFIEISQYLSFSNYNTLILTLAFILTAAALLFFALLVPINLISPKISFRLTFSELFQYSVIYPAAVLFIFARFIYTVFHDFNTFLILPVELNFLQSVNWKLLLAIISTCSVITGSFVVLWIYDLKKIITYIVIFQTGLLLLPLLSGSIYGLAAFITGLTIFTANSAGIIYCFKFVSEKYSISETSGLKGTGRKNKLIFFSLIYFLVSSAGFPLTAGFNLRLLTFSLPGFNDYSWLTAIVIISSLVFIYFIFRLSQLIFTGNSLPVNTKEGTNRHFILLVLLFYSIFASIFVSPILDWAKYCANLLGF